MARRRTCRGTPRTSICRFRRPRIELSTTGCGVPAGTAVTHHRFMSMSAMPASLAVGISGMAEMRLPVEIASGLNLPSRMRANPQHRVRPHEIEASAHHVVEEVALVR